jgi:hypothetical protein
MRKIISLFQRNYEGDKLVRDEIVPGAEWVVNGEGKATRKWDGTCTLVEDGKLFARFDAKVAPTAPNPDGRTLPAYKGDRQVPDGFRPSQDPDPITGHWPGWVPVEDQPQYKWHREAFDPEFPPPDGTYELCGPKLQGNPEGLDKHVLIRHDTQDCPGVPRDFDGLKAFFESNSDIEGIVWHHPDGRMVKIKVKDFGIKRKSPELVA